MEINRVSKTRATSFDVPRSSTSSIKGYSSSKSVSSKGSSRAQNLNRSLEGKKAQPQSASRIAKTDNQRLRKYNNNLCAATNSDSTMSSASEPALPPEPALHKSPWGENIIPIINENIDEFCGLVDSGMAECFGAIDKAKHAYIETNRKFLDILEKL
jgi:hypothetical protein